MQKLSIQQLRDLGLPERVNIRSLSNHLYRVELVIGGQDYLLADGHGTSRTFRSYHAVKELFDKHHYYPTEAYLHQGTTYGEMIGLDSSQPEDTWYPLNWSTGT